MAGIKSAVVIAMLSVVTGLTAQNVVATINLPDTTMLRDMVLNDSNNLIFCTDQGWKSLQIIDAPGRAFVDTVLEQSSPEGIVWNPATGKLYVSNTDSTVNVCDGTTGSVLNSITVGAGASALCLNETNNKLYCANLNDGTVSIIDCASETVLNTVTVGSYPFDLCWNAAFNKIYCTVEDGMALAIIDGVTDQLVGAVETGPYPWNVVSNDEMNRVYYSVFGSNSVEVVDCSTGMRVASISVGRGPKGIVWASEPNHIYVSCFSGRWVDVIDCQLNMVMAHVGVGSGVDDLLYEPTNNKVYCAATLTDTVVTIDCETQQQCRKLHVGFSPGKMVRYAVPGESVMVFVANEASKSITVLGDNPTGIAERRARPEPCRLAVWPNPARNQVTVRSQGRASALTKIEIVNASGRVRLEVPVGLGETNGFETRIGLTGLGPGVYFVRLEGDRPAVQQLVVAR